MRRALLSIVLVSVLAVPFRITAERILPDAVSAADTVFELKRALTGAWVGTLEYRDYSEPVGSTKRVKLPTWLTVEMTGGGGLRFRYVYDDGPAKTVSETSVVQIDGAAGRYESINELGNVEEIYAIVGLGQLTEGRGVLTLTGSGTENNAPATVKTTLRIGRNILEMTRETGAAGQALGFRHAYTFVRAVAPNVAAKSEPEFEME